MPSFWSTWHPTTCCISLHCANGNFSPGAFLCEVYFVLDGFYSLAGYHESGSQCAFAITVQIHSKPFWSLATQIWPVHHALVPCRSGLACLLSWHFIFTLPLSFLGGRVQVLRMNITTRPEMRATFAANLQLSFARTILDGLISAHYSQWSHAGNEVSLLLCVVSVSAPMLSALLPAPPS